MAQQKRNVSVATKTTNAGIPAQWIAFHGTIQGYGLFYLAQWHPFNPGLLYTVDRENQGDIVHLLLLSSSWKSHIFLALTVHLYKFPSSFPSLLLAFIICIFYVSATPHSLQDPSSPIRYWTQIHGQRKHQVLRNILPGNSSVINLFSREGGWEISRVTAF